jgi:hypothetical protein
VRQQSFDGDLRRVGRAPDLEPRQVPANRVVEPELPGIAELEDADAREELRDRADAVDRPRIRRHPTRRVREPEAAAPDDLLVVDDAGRDARDLVVGPLRVEPDAHQLERLGDPRMVGEPAVVERPGRRPRLATRQRRRLGSQWNCGEGERGRQRGQRDGRHGSSGL